VLVLGGTGEGGARGRGYLVSGVSVFASQHLSSVGVPPM
jgi:hypothetical protein